MATAAGDFPPKKPPASEWCAQESLDPRSHLVVVTAGLIEVSHAVLVRYQGNGFVENGLDFWFFRWHEMVLMSALHPSVPRLRTNRVTDSGRFLE